MQPDQKIVPSLEVEVYAPGMRDGDNILQLSRQMDMLPGLRLKIDAVHEIAYFESDGTVSITQEQLVGIFDTIGLSIRFIGDVGAKIPVSGAE